MNKNHANIYDHIDLCSCYEPFFTPPASQLDEYGFIASEPEPTLDNTSFYVTEPDGTEYFYCGNTRIKVSEHFADTGVTVNNLIENVVRFAVGNSSPMKKASNY